MTQPATRARARLRATVRLTASLLSLAGGLAGCALPAARDTSQAHQALLDRAADWQARMRQDAGPPPLVVPDPLPRFASRSIALRHDERLPAHLGRLRLHAPGRLTLPAAAELISRAIGLPVIMTPDALHNAADYAPGAVSRPPLDLTAASPEDAAAWRGAARAGAARLDISAVEHRHTLEIDHDGPLRVLLDRIAAQAGLQWAHTGGRIVFSRVITRAITLKALPGGLDANQSLEVMGGGEGSGGRIGQGRRQRRQRPLGRPARRAQADALAHGGAARRCPRRPRHRDRRGGQRRARAGLPRRAQCHRAAPGAAGDRGPAGQLQRRVQHRHRLARDAGPAGRGPSAAAHRPPPRWARSAAAPPAR